MILFCSLFLTYSLYIPAYLIRIQIVLYVYSTLHVGMIKTIVCFDEKYENDTLVRIIFTSIWAVLVLMSFA